MRTLSSDMHVVRAIGLSACMRGPLLREAETRASLRLLREAEERACPSGRPLHLPLALTPHPLPTHAMSSLKRTADGAELSHADGDARADAPPAAASSVRREA